MNLNTKLPDFQEIAVKDSQAFKLNFKRVFARAIKYWYLIVLSLVVTLSTAFVINRYSTKIYPVSASIIIKENDENVGAKFLYDNELLNPYRNFYNELYIMKSYPLLQEVMQSLKFDVSLFREGDIKTTEYYDPHFPVDFKMVKGKTPYGRSLYFKVNEDKTFSLQEITNDEQLSEVYERLHFNDTIDINGYSLFFQQVGDLTRIVNETYVATFTNPLTLAKRYSSRLTATWAQVGASVVNLEITGPVAQKEIDFLNKFIERYQFYDVEKKNRVATMALQFLDEQLVMMGDSLNLYEDQVENFKRKNIITTLEDETNRLYQKIIDLENQKFQYRLLENYYDYITKLLTNEQYDGIFTPSSVGITDEVVSKLISELINLQTEVDVYSNNQGVERLQDNPRLQDKLRQIQLVKNNILKTIENTRATQGINIQFINNQIKLVDDQLKQLPSTERELVTIQRNYSLRENLFVFLMQKRTEAGLSRASTTSDIEVVNPPMAGGSISPKPGLNYAIAGGAGIVLPILIFVLLELFNTRIQSKDDIELITSVPIIGGIGHNPASDTLIVYQKPRSSMAESFRALRSNLNYFTGNKDHQVFMVTSSIPGEGKSFTTINLATVFALAGKRTIIIGGDLRKPKMFGELMVDPNIGLSQFLSGMAQSQEIIQKTQIENLYIIAAGVMPPNPSELLLKPAMEELVNFLKAEFDFVIIDTPPLLFVADAFVLSTFVDHTLFVVRQDFSPKEALASLEDYYSAGKLLNVSILFNDLKKTGLGYGYGYGYAYGYGYGSDRKKTASSTYYED